jgi:glycosyltransferase involved in cell wall biosynthesis
MTMPHLVTNVLAVLEAKKKFGFPLVIVPMLHEHDPHWDVGSVAAALKLADAVVAMTEFEIQRLVESYAVPREKIFLGSVGIDAVPVTGDRPRGPRVAFLGRKTRSKGLDCLIDAMGLVWRDMPDAELYLAGVRVPETQLLDEKIAALPHHLRSKVHDLGVVDSEEKADLLRSARCLVLPSRTESFGMVILDAWVHATPVVVWDLPLFRSIVEQRVDGLLAEPIGAAGLAKAIVQLLADPALAKRLGEAGRDKAILQFSWGAAASGYLRAYEYAIGKSAMGARR